MQYHPEKNSFEWKINADRSFDAVQIEQIMSNKFIEKARQSKNSFASYDEYQKASIYNFQPTATTFPFSRIYRFPERAPTQIENNLSRQE
jgi:gamma-glutamyl hydrolase